MKIFFIFLLLILTGCNSKFNKNDVVYNIDDKDLIGIIKYVDPAIFSDKYIVCYKQGKVACFIENEKDLIKVPLSQTEWWEKYGYDHSN